MKLPLQAIIALFCLVSLISTAQDSLVRYEDIRFSSDFEKKALDGHFRENKTDYFYLLIASGKALTEPAINQAKEKFFNHLTALQESRLASKKNDKRIKLLYDDLHQSFLTKYEMNN